MAHLSRLRYEVLMKTAIFWNVSPHSLVGQMNTPPVDNSMNTHSGWIKTKLWQGTVNSTTYISIQNFIKTLLSNAQLNYTLAYFARTTIYYRFTMYTGLTIQRHMRELSLVSLPPKTLVQKP
jgi:hypothetical protein